MALSSRQVVWYLGQAAPSSTYGAAGALIVLMFWVYYSAQIFLFGAELTKAIDDARNPAPRKKRDLFAELVEGFEALREAREGKRTLRTHVVSSRSIPDVKPAELIKLREALDLSRPVFADVLRTNPRTLENWEQGRAKPNAQAALLTR